MVLPVFHREAETRLMLAQLAEVTDGYSLVIINNGFDDSEFLLEQKPARYVENEENVGVIRAVNQGLGLLTGAEYIAVLHNDLLIYEEGWLDHILDFMDRRPDVGLVGLAGRHAIGADGVAEPETTVVDMRGYPDYMRPTWRITEVAGIDGLGWVMRNVGLRLDESFGLMHAYDLDLSLQYIEAGYRVYVASVEVEHLAEQEGRSTRCLPEYLERVGGDDEAYQREAAEKLRGKWEHLLPICRGRRDEAYAVLRIESLLDQVSELEGWARALQEENAAMKAEMEKASAHFEKLERLLAERQEGPAPPVTPRLTALEKARRSPAFMRKKARRRDRGNG